LKINSSGTWSNEPGQVDVLFPMEVKGNASAKSK